MSDTPAAVLERAADLIAERGWHKGSYENSDGCLCVWGAVNVAALGVADADRLPPHGSPQDAAMRMLADAAMRMLAERIGISGQWTHHDLKGERIGISMSPGDDKSPYRLGAEIARWQDATHRTLSDVMAVLRAA